MHEQAPQPDPLASAPVAWPDAWPAAWSAASARGDLAAQRVLAAEAPTTALQMQAHVAAGDALLQFGNATLARQEYAAAAALAPADATISARLAQCGADALPAAPRRVLLFSGHMVDAPGRTPPRFPPDRVGAAALRIAAALDELAADAQDVAYSQAAAGGDLLFIEACLARKVRCEVRLPFDESEFIARSIAPVSDAAQWRARYDTATAQLPLRAMPAALGPAPPGSNAFERCNLWLLASALVHGAHKLRFICLWNGGGGDGPGGTRHMHDEVERLGGRVLWIDTRTL